MTVLLADIWFALRELAMRLARGMAWRLLWLVRRPLTARGKPKSILLVEMTRMGDVIFAIRLASHLKRCLPGTRIGLATSPAYAVLVRLLAKGVEPVPAVAGLGKYLGAFLAGRKGRWDMGVAASPALKNLVVVLKSGCRSAAGYLRPPFRWWAYRPKACIGPRGANLHTTPDEHLLARAGKVLVEMGLLLGRSRRKTHILRDVRRGLVRRVVMHAGGVWRFRRWPAERWISLAHLLRSRGIRVTLVIGPENRDEAGRFSGLERLGVTVCNAPGFRELVRILRASDLFIGPDSGVMHLAELLGVRVLALMGPSLQAQSGPLCTGSGVIVSRIHCSPCSQCFCVHPFNPCMARVKAGAVAKAAEHLAGIRRGRS